MSEIDIYKTAALAKLSFSEKEAETVKARLEKVIEYVSILDELDGECDAEYADGCPLREDTAEKCGFADGITAAAPSFDGEYIEVPKVVEKGEVG